MLNDQVIEESGSLQEFAWLETIAERVQEGALLPVISASVGDELVLGDYHALERAYADQYRVPQGNLPEMAQFASIVNPNFKDLPAVKDGYIRFIRNRLLDSVAKDGTVKADKVQEARTQPVTFSKFCEVLGYPHFEDGHPLLILAGFDLPIYVTTSYHGFIESALRSVGKEPRTDFCRWNRKLENLPRNILEGLPKSIDREYEPNPREPLVYHLRGYDGAKDSLALTEDEHLRVLVASSKNDPGINDPVHGVVRAALSDKSLMVLGYNLRSWEFRTVLWGLIRPRSDREKKGISIQLDAGEGEQQYFAKYMNSPEIELTAYWGTVHQYLNIVRTAVDKANADE